MTAHCPRQGTSWPPSAYAVTACKRLFFSGKWAGLLAMAERPVATGAPFHYLDGLAGVLPCFYLKRRSRMRCDT